MPTTRAVVFYLSILLVVAFSVLVAYFWQLLQNEYHSVFTAATPIHIIEEEFVVNPHNHASRMFNEAEIIWKSDSKEWKRQPLIDPSWGTNFNLTVESRPIAGPLSIFKVPISRASAIVNASADSLFKFLTSPQGYQVIDPLSDPATFDQHLERFPWANGRLEVAESHFSSNSFVVLNAIDDAKRIFCSKSILRSDRPGGSIASSEPNNQAPGTLRGINTFALKILPITPQQSRILLVNVIASNDLLLEGRAGYVVNCLVYFGPLLQRLHKSLAQLQLMDLVRTRDKLQG